jgi:uncharacterized protein with von Willebrand factor type A (vWA) domain
VPALLPNLLLFGRLLRGAGLDVHPGRMVDAIRALEDVGVGRRDDVRAVLRTLLVHRHEDLDRFDRAFDLFWRARSDGPPGPALFSLGERPRIAARPAPATAVSIEMDDASGAGTTPARLAVGAYSRAELSRTRDFAAFAPADVDAARRLLARVAWQLGTRRTRRWSRAPRGAVDLRTILRRNLTRGGELAILPRRQRRLRPRPIVVIGDVSGSMERYSRVLLHFAHALTHGDARVESFVFATRLTRVTPRMVRESLDDVRGLESVVRDVHDWGGGTRIGEALRTFNTRWARRVMRNGPVVLIVSDGWDRGDPALLARELARIRRSCRRVVWLNPLLASPGYEPLTRALQAALRHVDDFLPVHNLEALEQLAARLRGEGGKVKGQHQGHRSKVKGQR